MATIRVSKTIAAEPARVFAIAADLPGLPAVIPPIKRVELVTPGPVGKGTKFRETRIMFGREATETMEIVEFVQDRTMAMQAASCGAKYLSRFDFRPEGPGTVVEFTFEATPVSLLAKLMSPLMAWMRKTMVKLVDTDLECLKRAAEGRAGAGAAVADAAG
jgi:carbon monoxide dehydrogenase subunit G